MKPSTSNRESHPEARATTGSSSWARQSGTGKELSRPDRPRAEPPRASAVPPVNCGAISPTLIESELFGHEKGSFTGADRQHQGYFERATAARCSSTRSPRCRSSCRSSCCACSRRHVHARGLHESADRDVRVIAATNRDRAAVQDGKLREDLFYRLNVFPIDCRRCASAATTSSCWPSTSSPASTRRKAPQALRPRAIAALYGTRWPGNVRELKNYVQAKGTGT